MNMSLFLMAPWACHRFRSRKYQKRTETEVKNNKTPYRWEVLTPAAPQVPEESTTPAAPHLNRRC